MESGPLTPPRVLTCYYRPKPGGLCTRLFRAIEALLDRGCEVHYLAVEEFPVRHPRCHFHRLPAPPGEGLVFWAWLHAAAPWALLWLGVRHRITHAFAFATTYALFLQLLRVVRRLPTSLFLRADAIRNHQIKGRPRWLLRLEAALEGLALQGVRVHAVSRSLAAAVAARHLRAPAAVEVLPNDLPAGQPSGSAASAASGAEGAPAGRSELAAPEGTRRPVPGASLHTAAVGVVEARKNLSVLVEAIARLPSTAARLTLYGEGPEEARLQALAARLDARDRVELAGWVDRERIWPAVDLLLMPSLHEGAPNAVLEAVARGVAVLASEIPEHGEILPADDLLPADDPAAWAARIERIAARPAEELAAMRTRQAAAAEHLRFDWDEAVAAAVLEGGR